MKKNSKKKIIILLVLSILLLTGCTKTLTDSKKKPVTNKQTGQNLVLNILCKPTNEITLETYKKYKVNIDKLPKCSDFRINSGGYEGLWTSFIVKPLAWLILKIGLFTKNYALALILVTFLIRLVLFPFTKKTVMQSELMKKAQPEIAKIQKKYENKKDEDSMMKQSQEMMMIYKKYNISPASGCLFSFIQLPLFIGFYEAVQRFPAIFEDNFLGLQLGTTPSVGIVGNHFYIYLLLMVLIAVSTYYSFKMNTSSQQLDPAMNKMPIYMSIMIIITAFFMPSALCIYWLFNNLFTMGQNYLVKREKK